jgi:hypothetical protein
MLFEWLVNPALFLYNKIKSTKGLLEVWKVLRKVDCELWVCFNVSF